MQLEKERGGEGRRREEEEEEAEEESFKMKKEFIALLSLRNLNFVLGLLGQDIHNE